MVSRSHDNRFWSLLLTAYFVCVGVLGFSGTAWCLDWSTDKDNHLELASCYTEMSDSGYIPFPNCVAVDPLKTTESTTCLEINSQSIFGWRAADDRLTSSFSILPDRNSTAFLQLSALKSFAEKSLPTAIPSRPSFSFLNIQSKALRSVVLLIWYLSGPFDSVRYLLFCQAQCR